MSVRTALMVMTLALPLLALPVAARDMRMASAGGGSGGSDCPGQVEDTEDEVDPTRAGKRASRDKPVLTRGAEPQVTRPRWHSFLPGMFR
jgi:hypothetical protein